jgi:hypothetical protein
MRNDIWEGRPENSLPEELIAWALTEVAAAIRRHAYLLGTADAATPMGATELLSLGLKEGLSEIARAITEASAER